MKEVILSLLNRRNYIVLTGDVVGSSKVANRMDLSARLIDLCERLNKFFTPWIVLKFKVVSGDGIQGLLRPEANIFRVAYYIRAIISPYEMRLGFGIGGIDTELGDDVSFMDGECFKNAAKSIDRCKSTGKNWYS